MLSEVLGHAVAMRMPIFEEGASPRMKIEQLESYLLMTACTQGDLIEERLLCEVELRPLKKQWDAIVIPKESLRTKTEKAVEAAKREMQPALFNDIDDIKWAIEKLGEQIDRLENDSVKASRAYSMITGG